jgi:hypothetical protein
MHDSRPPLNRSLSIDDFRRYYWLKDELMAFCREQGISRSGPKLEISRRLEEYLATGRVGDKPGEKKAAGKARSPARPRLDAPIGTGYTSSEANGAFFKAVIGPQFRFTTRLMKFCRENPDKTWGDAVREWQAERKEKKTDDRRLPIAPQFQYNCYIRDFFTVHPDQTFAEVVKAWNDHKKQRR